MYLYTIYQRDLRLLKQFTNESYVQDQLGEAEWASSTT